VGYASCLGSHVYSHLVDQVGHYLGTLLVACFGPVQIVTVRKGTRTHSGDYEECRLLGYKNPVRTSQETHYVSTTELSRLMLCKI
jgi:hypothetical protein